jgi:hypothetical protein
MIASRSSRLSVSQSGILRRLFASGFVIGVADLLQSFVHSIGPRQVFTVSLHELVREPISTVRRARGIRAPITFVVDPSLIRTSHEAV